MAGENDAVLCCFACPRESIKSSRSMLLSIALLLLLLLLLVFVVIGRAGGWYSGSFSTDGAGFDEENHENDDFGAAVSAAGFAGAALLLEKNELSDEEGAEVDAEGAEVEE